METTASAESPDAVREPREPRRGHAATASLVSMALRALLLLGKFVFIVVLAKWTDTATVGIYALLVTISTIAVYVVGLELHTYTSREIVSDTGHGGAAHVQHHFFALAVMYVIVLPAVFLFMKLLGISGKFSFLLFAIVLLFEVLAQELGRYLLIMQKAVRSNTLQFIRGAAWMPLAIGFILAGNASSAIDFVLLSWGAGGLASCIFGLWNTRSWLAPRQRLTIGWFPGAFGSARHYFAVALLTQVQYYSDRFIIQWILGEAQVGVLSFYQSFASTMVAFVQTGVISVLLPQLLLAAKQRDYRGEARIRREMIKWGLFLAIGISAFLAVAMPFLLRYMGNSTYLEQLPLLYMLLVGNVILVTGVVVHLSLYARRKDRQLMRISLVVIPLGLVANLAAVPAYGLMGAAVVFCLVSSLDLAAKSRLLWEVIRADGGTDEI